MPRLVTPSSNPYANGSHTLTPYTRHRSEVSPSSSDKENATPEQHEMQSTGKVLASQAAFREKLRENPNSQYYDPFLPKEVTRSTTQKYRQLIQETNETRSELIKPGNNGIEETVEKADDLFDREVRDPTVANLDSKLLVNTSDLAKIKARNMNLGDAAFNIDEYVSTVVSFMGGQHYSEATQNADRGDTMDWAAIGRVAMRISRRPPTIDFMLGPLAAEKKERKVVRRQQEKRDNTAAVRPQELKAGDIQKQENATSRMVRLVAELLREHSPINLFEFVLHPTSFGQTIENIFYLSFSVRDARAKIEDDANGLPVVSFVDVLTEDEQAAENQQRVLEMTQASWRELVRLFNITESVIPDRPSEDYGATEKSWY